MAQNDNQVDVSIKLGADISGGVQSRAELEKIRAQAKKTAEESSSGLDGFGRSLDSVSKAAGMFSKILAGFGVVGIFSSLIAGVEKLSSLLSENTGKARELKDAARAEELAKSVGELADSYAKVKQELQDFAKEQNNVLELIDAEVKARRDLRDAEIDASEQKELAAIDANAEDAAEQKAVIQAKYQHIRDTGNASDRVEDLVLQRQKYATAADLDDKEAESATNQAASLREEARKYMSAAAEEGSKSTQLNERDRNGFLAKWAGAIKDIVTFNWGENFGNEETSEGDEIRKAYVARQKEYQKKAEEAEKRAAEQDRFAEGKRKDAEQKRKLADAMNGSVEAAQIAQETTQVKSDAAERTAASALGRKQAEESRKAKELAEAQALLASGEGTAEGYRAQIAANNRQITSTEYGMATGKVSSGVGSAAVSKLQEQNKELENLLAEILKQIEQSKRIVKKANERTRNSRGVDSTEGK